MEHGIVTDWSDMEKIWQYIYSSDQLRVNKFLKMINFVDFLVFVLRGQILFFWTFILNYKFGLLGIFLIGIYSKLILRLVIVRFRPRTLFSDHFFIFLSPLFFTRQVCIKKDFMYVYMNEKSSGKTHLHHSTINMEQLKKLNMIDLVTN